MLYRISPEKVFIGISDFLRINVFITTIFLNYVNTRKIITRRVKILTCQVIVLTFVFKSKNVHLLDILNLGSSLIKIM
jgi:hypothetical protein